MRGTPKICFFSPVRDRSLLDTTEFYAEDLRILRELGYDVHVATRWSEIPWNCDLYFVWWWSWAFLPVAKASLRGRPTLITGTFDSDNYPRRSWPQRALMKASARLANWNVMVSEWEHYWIHAELGVANSSHIPHSVDTRKYSMAGGEREEFCFTVCWMKRPNAQRKCMFELISSIPFIRQSIPHLRFIIAGSPEDGQPVLHAHAIRLGVDEAVTFLGRISTEEKIRRMQTCQVYVQPTRYEGFGVAIAEAMSCGAPVVTSRVGAVPEVVGECGGYVDGSDPTSSAAGVLRLV